MLGVVCPATKLRFEATGREAPVGNTVRYPAVVGLVTVTLSTTAVAADGTPPTPVICTSSTWSGPSVCPAYGLPLPGRVSRIRAGVSERYAPGAAGGGDVVPLSLWARNELLATFQCVAK